MTNAPKTRKTHVTRIFFTNKAGDVIQDKYVDVERFDVAKTTTRTLLGGWQGHQRKFRWMDDPQADDYNPNGNPARKTKIVKVCDAQTEADVNDPEEWAPVPSIVVMKSSGYDGNNNTGSQHKYHSGLEDDYVVARKVVKRKIIHYDTNIDDAAQAACDADPTLRAYVVPGETYQRDDSTADDSQFVDHEIVTLVKHRYSELDRRHGSVNVGLQTKLLNQYLIDESQEADGQVVGLNEIDPPYRLDPWQNIINVSFGGYDNRIVFAIDHDSTLDNSPNVYVSTDGATWQSLGSLAYTGDTGSTFINLGGYRRDIQKFVVSGVNSVFDGVDFINTNIDMVSSDGINWEEFGSDVDADLLFAYSKKAKKRDVNGYVYRVANGVDFTDTNREWNKVDDKRYDDTSHYARAGGNVIQRCSDITAKEDDDSKAWETVLTADNVAYVNFGPITVIKGTKSKNKPTVVCVAITPNSPNKFAILSSTDGTNFRETFTGPTIESGGADIVTFSSGRGLN